MDTLLRKEIDVYSQKHNIHGKIRDYSFVTKLVFPYNGKTIEIAIKRNPLKYETYEDIGANIIDSYIDTTAKKGLPCFQS